MKPFRKDTHLSDWISANPEVDKWFKRAKAKNADSAKVMASYIYTYWHEHLSKRLADIQAWVAEVKTQNKSDDLETKRNWGSELETWLLSKKLKKNSRRLTVAAVRNFFYDKVDLTDRKFTLASSDEAEKELDEKEELTPLTRDEVRTLIERCNPLYKAVFLTQLSGAMGVSELLYFNRKAYKYFDKIRARQVPLKVSLIRRKMINRGGEPYWGLLWDDAVDALSNYLREREKNLGRPLAEKEPLFINQNKKALTEDDIQWQMRRLRDRTGLERNVPGKKLYRFHSHELRDTFKTWCENKKIRNSISEFLLGHEVDANSYNKFSRTAEGEQNIRDEMELVRPELNILTGRGEKTTVLTAQKVEIEQLKGQMRDLTTDVLTFFEKLQDGTLPDVETVKRRLKALQLHEALEDKSGNSEPYDDGKTATGTSN
jgi:integrase